MIEELADMCVEDLREGINTESKFIQAEHELHMKLCSVDNAWGFLEEHIPKEDDHLHELNHIIYTLIVL